MEAASERRDPQTTRVPLDDVLVDLYPEGHDESFPADAIDVGLGGLAMRSAVLPDVGSKLRCRFRSPEDGGSVAADAEVVWAEDSGPNHGQFGLRFTELEQADAERIAGLIDAWHEAIGALSIANDVDDSIDMDRRVGLRIDGVGPTVETELVHADGGAMIVEQPLPFLTIGKGVESDGRRGMLEAVDLRMDGDIPRLTLTVLFDRASSTATDAGAPEALPETLDEESSIAEMAPAATMKAPLEMPVEPREIDARSGVGIDAPAVDDDEGYEAESDEGYEAESDEGYEADDDFQDDESQSDAEESVELQAAASKAEAKADPLLAELRSDPRAVATKALRRVLPLWVKVRAWLRVAWAKTGPWLKIAAARTRAFAGRCWTTLRNLRGKSSQKRTQRRPQQRQRQTRAPRRQARPGQRTPDRGDSKGGRLRVGRLVLVVALLGGAVALTGYAMAAGPVVAIEKAPIEEPEPAFAEPAEEPVMNPELGDDPSLEAEAAEPEGGQLEAPSFPAMPSASDGSGESLAFGEAHVAGGREFRLRLSVPPTALRGEPMDSGFKVTLEGANAIDGARRIGATHPRVARASILNQGERAVLEIRFAAGANPAYRVEARGDALLVTIGR